MSYKIKFTCVQLLWKGTLAKHGFQYLLAIHFNMEIMWNGSLLKQASSYHWSNCSRGTLISFFSHLVSSAAAQPHQERLLFLYLSVKWSTSGIRERQRGVPTVPLNSHCLFLFTYSLFLFCQPYFCLSVPWMQWVTLHWACVIVIARI